MVGRERGVRITSRGKAWCNLRTGCCWFCLCLLAVVVRGSELATIRFDLAEAGNVSVAVYDRSGVMLRTLLAGKPHEAGSHTINWDGLDRCGRPVPPGGYEWRLVRTPGFTAAYRFPLGTNPPDTPYAAWPGNHGGLTAVAADETGIYLGSSHSEALPTHIKLSPDYRARLWEKHQYAAGGNGSKRYVVSGGRLYNQTVDARIQIVDATTGALLRTIDIAGREGLETRDQRHAHAGTLSMGAAAGIVVVGDRERGQLRRYNADTGAVTATVPFDGVAAVGMAEDGTVYVAASGSLHALPAGSGEPRELAKGLTNPKMVEVDPQTGELLVVEGAPSHQIKRFSRDGALRVTYGVAGGRRAEGRYERPASFLNVADIAPLPDGGLAVTEPEIAPRRTAILNGVGQVITEWYGGNMYFQSAEPDPLDPSDVWFDSHWGWLVRARVDYEKGEWTPVGVYRYAGKAAGMIGVHNALPGYSANSWRPVRRNGVLYLVHEGQPNILRYDPATDTLVPAAVLRTAITHYFGLQSPLIKEMLGNSSKSRYQSYAWSDRNGDGEPQQDEVMLGEWGAWGLEWSVDADFSFLVTASDGKVFRLPVERWTEAGVPVYPSLDAKVLVAEVDALAQDGGKGLGRAWRDAAGDFYSVQRGSKDWHGDMWPAHDFGEARLVKYAPSGRVLWAVGRKAAGRTRDETIRNGLPPNDLTWPIRVIGQIGESVVLAERIVSPATVYTLDGLYAGRFLDNRAADGLPGHFYHWHNDPETGILSMINADMFRGGSVIRNTDGSVYWLAQGWNCSQVYRITGWDDWTRQSGTVEIHRAAACAQAAGTGLVARYFNNRDLAGEPAVTRTDAQVGFRWGGKRTSVQPPADLLPAGLDPQAFSVEWTGMLEPVFSEPFVFSTYARGAVQLWIDGELVIDDGKDYAGEQPYQYTRRESYKRMTSRPIPMTAGTPVSIRMAYRQSPPLAGDPERNIPQAHLNWESPSLSRQHIPRKFLYPDQKTP